MNLSTEEIHRLAAVNESDDSPYTEDGISALGVTPSEITQSAFVNGVCTITTPGRYTLTEDVSGTIQISVDSSILLDGNEHTLRPDPAHEAGQRYGVQVTENTGTATIENFGEISGFNGPGIRSEAFRTTTIRNNQISECGSEPITSLRSRDCQGIYAASQKVVISLNTLKDCGTPVISTSPGPGSYGILAMAYDGSVSENTITGCGKITESQDGRTGSYGIYASAGLTVSDNRVTDCGKISTSGAEEVSGTGIFSQGGIISGNTVTDCGRTTGAGGENIGNGIFGKAGTTIEGNTVTNSGFSDGEGELSFGFGIRTEDGSVRENVVTGCGRECPLGYGIQSVAGAEVTGNRISNSGTDCIKAGYGIFLSGGYADLILTDNTVSDCGISDATDYDGYGMLAMNSGSRAGSESIIRNNTITGTSATASLRLNSVRTLTMTENQIISDGPALDLTGGMPGESRIYNNAFNSSAYVHPDVTVAALEKYAWNAGTPVFETNIVGGEWIAGNWWGSADNTGSYSETHTSVKGFGKEGFEIVPDSGVYDEMPLCRLSESGGGELKITGGNGYTYDRDTMAYTITTPGEYWITGFAHSKPVIIASDDVTLDGGYFTIYVSTRTPRNTGIFAENRSNIVIKNCQVKRGDTGINVTGSDITITGNTVSESVRYGIYTCNAEVTENSVSTKDVGIHGTGTISENIVTAPLGIEVTDEADEVSVISDTVTSTETGISLPSDWTGRATLRDNVIKSDALALEINGGSGAVYNNLLSAETYVTGTAPASYIWNTTPTGMSGRNILLGKYIAGNYWTNQTGNGWSDTVISEKGYSVTPFEVTAGVYDNAPLCGVGIPPLCGVELTEAGGEGYKYSESRYAGCKYTITAPGYYYFGSQPHLVSIKSDDVILDGRNVLLTVPAKKNVISTSGSKENITVKNCYIDGGSIGIKLIGSVDGADVSVRDCTLRNTRSYGIYLKNGVVDGNVLTNCAYGGIGYHSIVTYDHAEVRDNIVSGSTKNGIYYSNTLHEGAGGAIITGNRVQDGRGDGISVTGRDANTTISSNTVSGMRHSGISITPGRNNPDLENASVSLIENTVKNCDIGIDSTVRTLRLTRNNQIAGCNTGISGAGAISENTIEDCLTGIAVPAETAVPVQITGNRITGNDCCALCLEGSNGAVYNNLLNTGTHLSGSATGAYIWNTTPVMEENVAGGRWTAGNWWGSSDGQSGYSDRNIAVNGYLGEKPENHYEPAAGVCDHYPLVQTAELLPEPELRVADAVILGLPAIFRADCTGRGISMCGSWNWTFTDAAGRETEVSESPAMEMEHTFRTPGHAEASLIICDRDGFAIGSPARWTGDVGCSALKIGIEDLEDGAAFATGANITLRADLPDLQDLENATCTWEFAGESLGRFSSPDSPQTELSFEKPGISGIRLNVTPGGADAESYPEGSVVCTVVVTRTPAVLTPPVPEKPVRPDIQADSPETEAVITGILVDQDDISGPAAEAGFSVRILKSAARDLPVFAASMGRPADAFLSFSIMPENLKDEKHLQYSAVISLCIPESQIPEKEKYNLRVCRFNTISETWEALLTTWIRTEAGIHHYEVQTPGFSDFTAVRAIPEPVKEHYSDSDGQSNQEVMPCNKKGVASFNGMIRTVSPDSDARGIFVIIDRDVTLRPAQKFYRAAEITIKGASAKKGANITFCVPDSIYRQMGFSKDDIALALCNGEEWKIQTTHFVREEDGMTYYSTHIPAPGIVAAIYKKGVTEVSDPVRVTETPTPETTASLTPAPEETTVQTTATPAEARATETPQSPGFGIITALAGAGAAVMLRGRRQ